MMAPIVWDEKLSAPDNARKYLPGLMREYFAQVRALLAADPAPAELHAIRLASKRIRYTLDLFRPCYGPGLKARMKTLHELQEVLGQVSDRAAADLLLQMLLPDSPARRRAVSSLRKAAAAQAAELRRHWREDFDAPGKEAWWLRYLATTSRDRK